MQTESKPNYAFLTSDCILEPPRARALTMSTCYSHALMATSVRTQVKLWSGFTGRARCSVFPLFSDPRGSPVRASKPSSSFLLQFLLASLNCRGSEAYLTGRSRDRSQFLQDLRARATSAQDGDIAAAVDWIRQGTAAALPCALFGTPSTASVENLLLLPPPCRLCRYLPQLLHQSAESTFSGRPSFRSSSSASSALSVPDFG